MASQSRVFAQTESTIAAQRMWRWQTCCCVAVLVWMSSPEVSQGQVFVPSWNINALGAFGLSGGTIDPGLVTYPNLNAPWSVATDGDLVYVTNYNYGTVGAYKKDGTPVNPSLITGLASPTAIAVADGAIYVESFTTGVVGKYSTSGATINASLLTYASHDALGLAVSGNYLYVQDSVNNRVGKFTTSGAVVNASLITGTSLFAIAVDGNNIYVSNGLSSIGKYTTDGAPVNTSLITGLNFPEAVSAVGNNLYVLNAGATGAGYVGKYTTAGATLFANLISGFYYPAGLAVIPPLPGDVNYDYIVNGQDIAQMASSWLNTGPSLADANGDGIVNGQDIALAASNWLAYNGPGLGNANAVPEPATSMLAIFAAILLALHRRWRFRPR